MQTLLSGNLFIHFEFQDPTPRIAEVMAKRPLLRGKLAEQLLLYDSIVIPTADFSVVPILAHWLGEGPLVQALESETIRFIRFPGVLGYVWGGDLDEGFMSFSLYPRPEVQPEGTPDWHTATIADPEEASTYWMKALVPTIKRHGRRELSRLIEKRTLVANLAEFAEKVSAETKRDLASAISDIPANFSLSQGDWVINGPRFTLSGNSTLRYFRPNGLRVVDEGDDADILLGVAALNLQLYLTELSGAQDSDIDPYMEPILFAKADRIRQAAALAEGLAKILEIHNMPSVSRVVAENAVTIGDIWDLRKSGKATQFRKWLHEHIADDPAEIRKAYVDVLGAPNWIDKVPAKVLRFLLVTALTTAVSGLPEVGTATGIAASALDAFAIDRVLSGNSPKLLVDELDKMEWMRERKKFKAS